MPSTPQPSLRTLTARWLQESSGAAGGETLRLYGTLMEQYVLPRVGDGLPVSEAKVREFKDGMLAVERRLTEFLVESPSERHLGIFLMLTSGLPIGEVIRLQWEDVSITKGEIVVRSERGPMNRRDRSVRWIPLDERQKLYLRKMKGLSGNYVCSGMPEPVSRQQVESAFRNFPEFLPHLGGGGAG